MIRQRGGELLEINVDGDDTDARRFYERHGYVNSEPGEDQPLLYYYRERGTPRSGSNIGTSRRAIGYWNGTNDCSLRLQGGR